MLAAGALALLGHSAQAAVLPPGFSESVFVSGLPAVTSLAWSPTGELWMGGKNGAVWVRRRDGTVQQVADLPVSVDGERGVLGVAVDPHPDSEAALWVYYTAALPIPHNRISRFRDDGAELVDEVVVVEGPAVKTSLHNGGGLRFGLDGTLFASMGDDDQRALTAQDPHDLRGKVLHFERDGSPAADNPFASGRSGHPLVWALGLRNPFSLSVQPGSGALWIADVGATAWEELDLGVTGGNYGWDHIEGPEPPGEPGYVYPLYAYAHDGQAGNAVIAGDFAPAGQFPEDHAGNYFFADEPAGRIYRMVLDGAGRPHATDVWATDVGTPAALAFGPDGALYYADFEAMQVRRIAHAHEPNRLTTRRAGTPTR